MLWSRNLKQGRDALLLIEDARRNLYCSTFGSGEGGRSPSGSLVRDQQLRSPLLPVQPSRTAFPFNGHNNYLGVQMVLEMSETLGSNSYTGLKLHILEINMKII